MAENRIDELKDVICELVNLAEDADITREVFETLDNAGAETIDCLDELKALRHFESNYEHNLNVEYNKAIDECITLFADWYGYNYQNQGYYEMLKRLKR